MYLKAIDYTWVMHGFVVFWCACVCVVSASDTLWCNHKFIEIEESRKKILRHRILHPKRMFVQSKMKYMQHLLGNILKLEH